MDLIILKHGQVMRMTTELAHPLLTTTRVFELLTDSMCIATLHGRKPCDLFKDLEQWHGGGVMRPENCVGRISIQLRIVYVAAVVKSFPKGRNESCQSLRQARLLHDRWRHHLSPTPQFIHGTGGERNIQPPAPTVSAATTLKTFGPTDLISPYSVFTGHGQMTWTTTELETPSPNYDTTPREGVSVLDQFNMHRCPTRRVFGGTGLELVACLALSGGLTTGLPQPPCVLGGYDLASGIGFRPSSLESDALTTSYSRPLGNIVYKLLVEN
ncbi:uncharacterized protein TNCV_3039821 [Trichonephila clavipes]|uniref:Uncharacterized protein n=1 Tax=Trichonephila clavipes TaxID=2585209 RepID=A0A8X6S2T9_TRICX|nr:uncharacterized protein TNCV_3039821 [Trichonephila clavipes]